MMDEDEAPQPVAVVFGGRAEEPPDDQGDWTWVAGGVREWDGAEWIPLGWWQRPMRDEERLC